MRPLDFESVSQIVKPHVEDMVNCIDSGFYGYFEKYQGLAQEHSVHARCRLIYEEIGRYVKACFNGKNNAQVKDHNNETYYLSLGNRVSIRFKKHSSLGLTRNIPTELVESYQCQQSLEGFEAVHLNCGYIADPSFRNIQSILLTCPKTRFRNHWTRHLTADEYIQSIVNIDEAIDKNEIIFIPTIKIKTRRQNAANEI